MAARTEAPSNDASFVPNLACPRCDAALSPEDFTGSGAQCPRCHARYGRSAGILDMIADPSLLNASEVETQDRVSANYDDVRYALPHARAYHESTMRSLSAMVPPRGAVLDDGCGTGMMLEHVRERGAPLEELVGMDVSVEMLKRARARAERNRLSYRLVRGDACRLPFRAESFDVVYARSILHHLPSPDAGAREIARVLRPGGDVVFLEPNETALSRVVRGLARKGDKFDEDHKEFRADDLVALVRRHLDVVEVKHAGYIAYPLLGFPDVLDFSRVLPLARMVGGIMWVDDRIADLPVIKRLSWAIVVRARRR